MNNSQLILLGLLVLASMSSVTCLWPRPQKVTYGTQQILLDDPCAIHYQVEMHGSDYPPDYVEMMIGIYQRYTFRHGLDECTRNVRKLSEQPEQYDENDIYFNIRIVDWDLKPAKTVKDENYTL